MTAQVRTETRFPFVQRPLETGRAFGTAAYTEHAQPPGPKPGETLHDEVQVRLFPTVPIDFLLPMIPNVAWILLPPVSSLLQASHSTLAFIEVAGTLCRSLMVALLIPGGSTPVGPPGGTKKAFTTAVLG